MQHIVAMNAVHRGDACSGLWQCMQYIVAMHAVHCGNARSTLRQCMQYIAAMHAVVEGNTHGAAGRMHAAAQRGRRGAPGRAAAAAGLRRGCQLPRSGGQVWQKTCCFAAVPVYQISTTVNPFQYMQ
jgi:hypothetical protein